MTSEVKVDEGRGKDGKGFYIRTFTGKKFHFNDIENNEVDIRDIAHALALRARWSGHTKFFYSIAQHSVLAARHAPKGLQLTALLHDANETYLPDFSSPLKWFLRDEGVAKVKELEALTDQLVYKTFNLAYPMDRRVKIVDQRMLATESRDLMNNSDEERSHMDEPYKRPIKSWSPQKAEREFLKAYEKYTKAN